jgi:hypothetical protein
MQEDRVLIVTLSSTKTGRPFRLPVYLWRAGADQGGDHSSD